MSFETIKGYKEVKDEFELLKNLCSYRENLDSHGIMIPDSLLLYGPEGMGKKFMAEEFVKELPYESFTFTADDDCDSQRKEFHAFIDATDTEKLYLINIEGIDKIAAMQGGEGLGMLSEFLDLDLYGANFFVIATADKKDEIPESFFHDQLFERSVCVAYPDLGDVTEMYESIIQKKNLVMEVSVENASSIFFRNRYREIESIIDMAAAKTLIASKGQMPEDGKLHISEECFMNAVLEREYDSPTEVLNDEEELFKVALHEAGHIIAGELVQPGCVGYASIRTGTKDEREGFTARCADWNVERIKQAVYSLAGKAAVELRYGADTNGSSSDIDKAIENLVYDVYTDGIKGLSLVILRHLDDESETLKAKQEDAVYALLNEAYRLASHIVSRNAEPLEALARALMKKTWLLHSEIREILTGYTLREE